METLSFTNFLKVGLRQQAIYLPESEMILKDIELQKHTMLLVADLAKLGFGLSEDLCRAVNQTSPQFQEELGQFFREMMGVNKNWTPLVKGWDTPTGETRADHIITFFANVFGAEGTTLPCGHTIPARTFPLERYNGCPFCGTPFEFGEIENYGQGSKLKILELWTISDAEKCLKDLLTSKTPLDATQIDSLRLLVAELPLPEVEISMKETLMNVIDTYISQNQMDKAHTLFASPTDILRYLWYKKTGFLQIIEPKTIIQRKSKNRKNFHALLDKSEEAKKLVAQELKLKYSRKECRMVANWLNNMELSAEKMYEIMHPKRQMWVRFIRALRLPEYAQKAGFENLKRLLDVFYNQKYHVWQADFQANLVQNNKEKTLLLLQQRAGLFARSLFSVMLRFGAEEPLLAFRDVIDQVPARLLLTLNMYAENYFNKSVPNRVVKPLGGTRKAVPKHKLLANYSVKELHEMKLGIEDLCLYAIKKCFYKLENQNKTIFIDSLLFYMPLPIGDRSETIQDLPSALMGTRFVLEGMTIRLFMQWGEGLPAQHLDMDLSCVEIYENKTKVCYYGNLTTKVCKHSGDIQRIPEKVGTAEYIDIDIKRLREDEAKYVVFTCNAYSNGEIMPNLTVGWMDSQYPMKISEKTGVAYDPSCVQHQVRITQNLSKGLVFGVLDMETEEIIWLEMPFSGQMTHSLNIQTVQLLLDKLNSKLSVGNLLKIKAEAQGLAQIDAPNADENYTQEWVTKNMANLSQFFVD